MIKTSKLKGLIAEQNKTQSQVAKEIGVSPATFYRKMTSGVFGSDEIEKLIVILNIDDPLSIFLSKNNLTS